MYKTHLFEPKLHIQRRGASYTSKVQKLACNEIQITADVTKLRIDIEEKEVEDQTETPNQDNDENITQNQWKNAFWYK